MLEKPWLSHYDPGVPATLEYPQVGLTYFLDHSASDYPTKACTIYQDRTVSFAEMEALSSRLAERLAALGLKKGGRVGLLMPNIPQFVLGFYAILKAGGVVVALNPQYKQRELEYQIKDSGLQVLIAMAELSELIDQVRQSVQSFQVIYTALEDAFELGEALQAVPSQKSLSGDLSLLELLRTEGDPAWTPPRIDPEDVAVFQYSGGTTGDPKAAVGLHRNLVANTVQFRRWLVGLEEGKETVLAAIPLYHVYGMVIAMSLGIALGASLVLIPNPRDMDDLLAKIERYEPTLFPGVPNMYQAINHHPAVIEGKVSLRSIKACISGSAPLLAETKRTFEAVTGGKLMEGYGLSEAPTATHCNPMLGENRTGSIGLPLPDVDCQIVDLEDGVTPLGAGERGELVIKGPQVMRGYHQRPEEDRVTLVNGWLHTGDIAWMDADGYFYLVDRKKELIKIGGFQVWPREVEEVIALHPAVKEVAVSGVLDEDGVEIVKAWVVLKPGSRSSQEEIRVWCRQHLAGYKTPAIVAFRDDLPRTMVGKVLRRELRRLHSEGLA
jgi:long-chain acyl-CoA synthetase